MADRSGRTSVGSTYRPFAQGRTKREKLDVVFAVEPPPYNTSNRSPTFDYLGNSSLAAAGVDDCHQRPFETMSVRAASWRKQPPPSSPPASVLSPTASSNTRYEHNIATSTTPLRAQDASRQGATWGAAELGRRGGTSALNPSVAAAWRLARPRAGHTACAHTRPNALSLQ